MECNLNKFEDNNVRKSGQYAAGGGRKDCQTDCTTGWKKRLAEIS